ncbi:hypothetical protein SLS62_005817 [Diatrype stigma]|uniref:Uncharacterized protein n=1 Tax=Diatrype stigma TaxID=117547 RepID=A0AAN9US64_9PEZI
MSKYQTGDFVMFQGRELEHFVGDWKGYRVFVAATNHQPIRDWFDRRVGRAPAVPSNPMTGKHYIGVNYDDDGDSEDDEGGGRYVVRVESNLDPEEPPESGWVDWKGAAWSWRLVV